MPAEWAPHARTWMMWPSRREVWDDMAETKRNYAAIAHAIRDFEPLTMLVRPEDRAAAQALLGADIELLDHPIDDSWARDAGPCFLTNDKGGKAGVSFRFNAWGEKYAPYDGDAAAAIRELTGGGAQVSLEALGVEATTNASVECLATLGRHVHVGMPAGDGRMEVNMRAIYAKQLAFYGTRGMPAWKYPSLLEMIERGAVDLSPMVAREVPLSGASAELRAMQGPTSPGTAVITDMKG